ncbi:hypothetical protein [Telluribacter sp.]|jgi:hypothetical protein|uniref:hypothetical protein n=1 Tax=Telluribacter sp. TaxID=1978767 RepID=UPI002E129FF9|nr:hypothetical protein [Telluribacter sp.]
MKVLLASTVQEFYRQRAGFFFVVLGLIFGFLSGREHHAFAVFFLNDEHGMLYLLLIWGLYTGMVGQFVEQLWSLPAYTFVYQARLLPPLRRYYYLLAVALGLLQPILFYGTYIFFIARQEARQDGLLGQYWPVPVYWLLLTLLLVALAEHRLRNPGKVQKQKAGTVALPFRRPRSWTFWTLEWLLRERGLTLLISKAGALLFFSGTLIYYHTGTYDLRLPAIGCTFAYLLNAGVSYELYLWESRVWQWGRSLPVAATKRYGRLALLHAILLLPETCLALRYLGGELSPAGLLQLYSLGLGALLLYHSYLYRQHQLMEDTVRPVFILFVLLTFTVMYKVPLWLIAPGLLVGSAGGWWRWKER